jgi:hypothetical protein
MPPNILKLNSVACLKKIKLTIKAKYEALYKDFNLFLNIVFRFELNRIKLILLSKLR